MSFRIETFLNPYLPADTRRVDAVFSLSMDGAVGPLSPPRSIIGLLGDASGSMAGEKIAAMKHALCVAINQFDDEATFFVVAFSEKAKLVVKPTLATPRAKREAQERIGRIEAGGGTAMSTALQQARKLFAGCHGAVCQAILLTDGHNEEEDAAPLKAVLEDCAGLFQVHCRGFGTDWSPKELRSIAEHLLGTVRLVAGSEDLAQDFQETVAAALSKTVAAVRLRLWLPRSARLAKFKQGFPTEIDLTDQLSRVDERSVEFSLGAWDAGTQDYAACFDVAPLAVDEQMLVCRPSIVHADPATGEDVVQAGSAVTVCWTQDASLSARINAQVAHYSGQAEKAQAIQEGLDALAAQDESAATRHLGRALQLAELSGDAETTRRLRQVVDVVDATGTVRLRQDAGKVALMDLDAGSTRTVRARRG